MPMMLPEDAPEDAETLTVERDVEEREIPDVHVGVEDHPVLP